MTQNINSFGQSVALGQPDLKMNFNTVSVQIDTSSAGSLKPGQLVKLVNSAGGVPKVVEIAADTDIVFGCIQLNAKDIMYNAGDKCEIAAFHGNCVYMQAVGAIARGARVKAVAASPGYVNAASTGDHVSGIAFDAGVNAGDMIRVVFTLPAYTVV